MGTQEESSRAGGEVWLREQCLPCSEEGAQEVGFTLHREGLGLDQIDARATSKLRSGLPVLERGFPAESVRQ